MTIRLTIWGGLGWLALLLIWISPAQAQTVPPAATPSGCDSLFPRPTLSGTVQRYETPNFVVHYTLEGTDGTTPHFIDEVARAMQHVWDHHFNVIGWAEPPADCGEGGDTRFDVYVMELLDTNHLGVATRERVIGNNPATPQRETTAAYSYLSIDNDFSLVDAPLSYMRTSLAHEFTHNIQFGYDSAEPFFGIYESTATYIEAITFPDDEQATQYARTYFEYTDVCIGGLPLTERGFLLSRVYAEWMLIDTIVQLSDTRFLVRLWENAVQTDGIQSFYRSVHESGTTPIDAVTRLALRALLRDFDGLANDDSRVKIESNVNGAGVVTPRGNGIQQLAADFVYVAEQGNYTFSINDPLLTMYAVGVSLGAQTADIYPIGQSGTVDTRAYDFAYVIIINTRRHDDPMNCEFYDWALDVNISTAAQSVTPVTWRLRNFIPAG